MTIIIDIDPEPEIVELYDEATRLLSSVGGEPMSLERWYANMLMLGSTPHVAANARALNKQMRRKHNIGAAD